MRVLLCRRRSTIPLVLDLLRHDLLHSHLPHHNINPLPSQAVLIFSDSVSQPQVQQHAFKVADQC